jgi:hypothetical protein
VEEILQFLLELFFQAFIELLFDFVFREMGVDRRVVRIGLYSIVGGVVGAISLAVLHHPIIGSNVLRYVSLFVTPLLLGLAMHWLGRRRRNRGGDEFGLESFWPSWSFAFCFGLVRLLFAR